MDTRAARHAGVWRPPRQPVRRPAVQDWRPALQVRCSVRLLLSESVEHSDRKAEAVLRGRAETGSEILRREFKGDAWGQVVLANDAGAGGKGIGIRVEPEKLRSDAVGVAGEISVRPATHYA